MTKNIRVPRAADRADTDTIRHAERPQVGHAVQTFGDAVESALSGNTYGSPSAPTRIAISSYANVIIDEQDTEMPERSLKLQRAHEMAQVQAVQQSERLGRRDLARHLQRRGDEINALAIALGEVLEDREALRARAADLGRAARAAHQAGEKARNELSYTERSLVARESDVARLEREVRSLTDDKAAGREQNERLIENVGELRRKLKTAEAAADQLLTERGRQNTELQNAVRTANLRGGDAHDLCSEETQRADRAERKLKRARKHTRKAQRAAEQVRGALEVAEGMIRERDAKLAECERAQRIAKVVDHVQDTGRDATIGGVELTKRKGTVIGHATPEQTGASAALRKLYGDRYVDGVLGTRPAYQHVNAPCSVEPVLIEPPVSLKTHQRTVRNLRRARAQRRALQVQLAELRAALLGLAEQK